MLSSNKPRYYSRLPKPNLKIPLIYCNILRKQLFQPTYALTAVVVWLHTPKFQIFSTESNMMVKVVTYLPLTAVYSCLLKKNAYSWVFFLLKFQAYIPPKKSTRDVFLIFQNTFFAKHVWVVTASAKHHSFSLFRRPHQ